MKPGLGSGTLTIDGVGSSPYNCIGAALLPSLVPGQRKWCSTVLIASNVLVEGEEWSGDAALASASVDQPGTAGIF